MIVSVEEFHSPDNSTFKRMFTESFIERFEKKGACLVPTSRGLNQHRMPRMAETNVARSWPLVTIPSVTKCTGSCSEHRGLESSVLGRGGGALFLCGSQIFMRCNGVMGPGV